MRLDPRSPAVVAIRRWGSAAARTCARRGHGSVIAVFEASFYCRFNNRLICVGPAGLPPGPLNIETDRTGPGAWRRSGILPGATARLANNRLYVGDVVFAAHQAVTWRPPVLAPCANGRLRRGEAVAAGLMVAGAPPDSLAALWQTRAVADDQPMTLASALRSESAAACAHLRRWLATILAWPDRAPPAPQWLSLVGLGRGLTPAGDDLLGGALVALAAFGAETARRGLADIVCRETATRTSPISAAHLQLAARGQGGEALHLLIAALAAGEATRIRKAVATLAAVGHTSGWDMLAGVLLATRVLAKT